MSQTPACKNEIWSPNECANFGSTNAWTFCTKLFLYNICTTLHIQYNTHIALLIQLGDSLNNCTNSCTQNKTFFTQLICTLHRPFTGQKQIMKHSRQLFYNIGFTLQWFQHLIIWMFCPFCPATPPTSSPLPHQAMDPPNRNAEKKHILCSIKANFHIKQIESKIISMLWHFSKYS